MIVYIHLHVKQFGEYVPFDIHHKWPSVQMLTFHLLYEQPFLFKENDEIDEIFNKNEHKRTMSLAWFEENKTY